MLNPIGVGTETGVRQPAEDGDQYRRRDEMGRIEQIRRWKKQLSDVQAAIEKLLKGERLPGVSFKDLSEERRRLEWAIARAQGRTGPRQIVMRRNS